MSSGRAESNSLYNRKRPKRKEGNCQSNSICELCWLMFSSFFNFFVSFQFLSSSILPHFILDSPWKMLISLTWQTTTTTTNTPTHPETNIKRWHPSRHWPIRPKLVASLPGRRMWSIPCRTDSVHHISDAKRNPQTVPPEWHDQQQ